MNQIVTCCVLSDGSECSDWMFAVQVDLTVGTMKLSVVLRQSEPDRPPTADACIIVNSQPQPVELSGIVLSESRPGWVSLELPPTEQWEDRLRWLTPNQQERIASPEFYQYLQRHLGERFLSLRPDG